MVRIELTDYGTTRPPLLDMDGAFCVGYLRGMSKNGEGPRVKAICEDCRRPTGCCRWLLRGRPYKGSKYMARTVPPHCGVPSYAVYAIIECPMYE